MPPLQSQLRFYDRETQQPSPCVPIDETFPEQNANELARLESFNKHLFRPNTYLHKWWARRSGTTFRFILKGLVPDEKLRGYYTPGGLEGFTVLDPMMGGGTTLHEAIRLGANVIGYDLDPVPVLQARAALSVLPAEEKEQVFQDFLKKLERKVRPFFHTRCLSCERDAEVQFLLYGVRKRCKCGEALVIDSFILREEPGGQHKRIQDYYPEMAVERRKQKWRLFEKRNVHCRVCNESLNNSTDLPFPERYTPLVTVGCCSAHGQFFKAVDKEDLNTIARAKKASVRIGLPDRESALVMGGPKSSDLLSKNIECYLDLFTPRQLLYLGFAKALLDEVRSKHRLWLALLISTSLEFNSILCGYKGSEKRRPGAIRHVFSHHAYSFPYTSLENNPVFSQKTSGTLRWLFDDRIKDAGVWALAPIERKPTSASWRKIIVLGETDGGQECSSTKEFSDQKGRFIVEQRDSSQMPLPDDSVDYVVTDPPYFDSVQYSDLSSYFRVWLQWFLPNEANWTFAPLLSAVAEKEGSGGKYRAALKAIFRQCNRVLRRPYGRLIFTFHHWHAEAWIQLTLALKDAEFRLVTSYTVHSENTVSVHIRQLKALKHDSILILRPKEPGLAESSFTLAQSISNDDSFSFCRDCSRLLGYLLDSEHQDSEIDQIWRKALGD